MKDLPSGHEEAQHLDMLEEGPLKGEDVMRRYQFFKNGENFVGIEMLGDEYLSGLQGEEPQSYLQKIL